MGDSYLGLGLPDDAVAVYEKAVAIRRSTADADTQEVLASITNLAIALQAAGRLDEAVPLHQESLERN